LLDQARYGLIKKSGWLKALLGRKGKRRRKGSGGMLSQTRRPFCLLSARCSADLGLIDRRGESVVDGRGVTRDGGGNLGGGGHLRAASGGEGQWRSGPTNSKKKEKKEKKKGWVGARKRGSNGIRTDSG